MRALVFAAAILLAQSVNLAQDKPDEEAAKKAQKIEQAVGWLANDDPDVREMGRKSLVEFGRDAIPAIERKLAERKAMDLVQMLRVLDRTPGSAEAWVSEKELRDLEADEQYRKEAERLSKDSLDKLMYVKYQEAMAHVRHKNYQRAFELANALIAMDTRSNRMDDYRRLRRHCENMITQTSLIEAKILQPKVWYLDGETVELTTRMKNLWKAGMTLSWEKGTEKEPGGGLLLLDVDVTMKEMGGASMSDQRHQELRFEEEVPIAPGAQWEKKFVLDTTTTIPDAKQIRIISVGGWSQPAKIATDGVNITRRVQFEPALVKILPKKYERFLDNPLQWLDKMIAEGDPQEIYVCSQLLEGDDRDKGTEKLIGLLSKSNTVMSKTYAANILNGLTGVSLGVDPRRWEAWLQNKMLNGKETKKK
ncbi:MAG TPA: hypothetical protein VKW04_04290 [Planctomycetota bacterium]|nr:hypothetical protein [Planctomycetota bacterium]